MQLTKCINNHFYDADRFQTCPHCGAAPDGKRSGAPAPQNGGVAPKGGAAPSMSSQGTVPMNGPRKAPPVSGGTAPMRQPGRPAPNGGNSLTRPSTPPANVQRPQPPVNEPKPNGLGSAVDDAQKTVGLFVKGSNNNATQPVVGWLVCVEGEHFGEDFRICMGRNFVGRAKNMDIVLSKDSHVSRDKHAVIVYEPKNNLFVIQTGESKELSYLNDEVVLSPKELKPYDKISLGSTKLLFVPFCNDQFKWEEDKEEDK